MLFSTLALLTSLAVAAPLEKRAGGVFTAPVTQIIKEGTKPGDIVSSDAARHAQFKAVNADFKNAKRATDASITNGVVSYYAEIGFGTPATNYKLIVDTGSSNTWAKSFKITSDAKSTGESVSVTYGSGSFSGTEYTDSVTLATGLTVTNQGVGRASRSSGFTGVDGILGVGPEDLTQGTTSGGEEIPTVVQTAKSEGLISAAVLGVSFKPSTSDSGVTGTLTYGGTDSTQYTGTITYQSVTTQTNAQYYWGLTITSSLGSSRSGIVDTGTTLVYLPTSWYNKWLAAIPSAAVDSSSGLVRFPKSSLSSVPDITFNIGGKGFVLNKYAQLVEQGVYSDFGLSTSYYYAWIADYGADSDLSFIIGQKFLERYYSVYDTDNNRIGFASTAQSTPTAPQ